MTNLRRTRSRTRQLLKAGVKERAESVSTAHLGDTDREDDRTAINIGMLGKSTAALVARRAQCRVVRSWFLPEMTQPRSALWPASEGRRRLARPGRGLD